MFSWNGTWFESTEVLHRSMQQPTQIVISRDGVASIATKVGREVLCSFQGLSVSENT